MHRKLNPRFLAAAVASAFGGLFSHAAATSAFTSAGTRLYVFNGDPATFDAAGYAALAWVEVGEVVDIPEFGKEYNLVTHNPLKDRRTRKKKGSFNNGSFSLNMARCPGDAGQAEMIEALDLDDPSSFKAVLQDGTAMYFQSLVMSYKTGIGSVDQITAASATLEIDSEIVEVAP
jgi:hypothetical protein